MVYGFPVVAVNREREPLFVARGVHHQGATVVHIFDNALPHQLSNSSRYVAHKDARTDLEEPPGQVAAQAGGNGGENDNGQNSSP
ncbi:hypothetical protein MSIMFI_04148 [Mycobacterium simulans]|nr:hypothetical protein MSIMFI_04148 [Mycobacterium simulans]